MQHHLRGIFDNVTNTNSILTLLQTNAQYVVLIYIFTKEGVRSDDGEIKKNDKAFPDTIFCPVPL